MIKLKELLDRYGLEVGLSRKHFQCTVESSKDGWCQNIKPLVEDLSLDSEVELHFYWNWGCLPEGYQDKIQKALDDKDWSSYNGLEDDLMENHFMSFIFTVDKPVDICFNDDYIADLPRLDEFLLQHLDFHECEHG